MSVGQEWERVDWDSAEMHPGVAGGWFLVVRGVTPVPMDVELHSLPIPIAPEEYRGVEVRARRDSVTTDVETPFEATSDTKGFNGTIGFELIGKTKQERFPPEKE